MAALTLLAGACGGGGFELSIGDCVRTPPEGAGPDGFADVTVVDCDEPHELEVFHVFELGPEQITGDAMVSEIAQACLGDAWTHYLGVPAGESPIELLPIPPDSDELAAGEDREVICTVREPGGATRTGALRAGSDAAA
ncbi:MAG: hypothetical protein WD010_05670 [Nitriliruptor sp.]|uniref:hypothetical protein n=1 Tax=Nitriliruptor sp. TaxID=2448056 RepID=UPI0034A06ED9